MSFSHCLPAGKIKRWVFLTGPKSLLSSPLTVPMATSSSGAADGGCRPTSSTWPQGPAWSSELGCAVVTARADRLKMAHYSLQHYTELFWLIRTYTSVIQCCAGTLGPQDVLAIKVFISWPVLSLTDLIMVTAVSHPDLETGQCENAWGSSSVAVMMSPPNAWISLRHSCRRSADSLPATQQFPRILFTRHKGVSERLRQRRGMQLWQLWVRGETLILTPQQRWHHIVTITKTQNTEMLL